MAAVAKGVMLSLGLITTSVSVHSALEPKTSSNKQVCVGIGKDHTPALIRHTNTCADCGEVPYDQIRKAREVSGGLVLIEAEDVEKAKGTPEEIKKAKLRMAMTPHPAGQVDLGTAPGGKLYHLTPDAGHEVGYAILRHMIEASPELAFMVQWTPRSATGTFAIRLHDGILVAQERVVAEHRMRATPTVNATADEAMLGMAAQWLSMPGVISDFDPATYLDQYETKLAEIIASKTPIQAQLIGAAELAAAAPVGATAQMDALKAMLAAASPPAKAPAKRAPRKKSPAKSAVAA